MPALNVPYPHLCQVLSPQTSHKCPYSHPLYIRDLAVNHSSRLGKKLHCHKWGLNKVRELFFSLCVHRMKETANQGLSKGESRHGHIVVTESL